LSKVLAYCAYLKRTEIMLPPAGVNGAPLQLMARNDLRIVWSQVDWPFAPQRMQQFAVDFHNVVSHVFRQAAVAPFQLLTVFDSREELAEFARANEGAVVADLERLKAYVQMECVAYVLGERRETAPSPDDAKGCAKDGAKAHYDPEALIQMKQYTERVKAAVAELSREVKVREVRGGNRIFALVDRGQEQVFLQTVHDLPLPGVVSRRFKGPDPAGEFLSVRLGAQKAPEQP
jgi:hypothetical protein